MDDTFVVVCKILRWNISLITKARNIKEKPNFEFQLESLFAELDECDKNRRNFYLKSAKFDVVKHLKFTFTFTMTTICTI
ncbi:hypothetical protein FACS1894105_03970 [Clostridia bacterium]|nr:hypothetical protein FACS1894105_03970 [Clostridia bacterium]